MTGRTHPTWPTGDATVRFDNCHMDGMSCMPVRLRAAIGGYNVLHRRWEPLIPVTNPYGKGWNTVNAVACRALQQVGVTGLRRLKSQGGPNGNVLVGAAGSGLQCSRQAKAGPISRRRPTGT